MVGGGQGPRKSVRLVRIFLDKSKSRGQFWSETTSETNRQTVNGHFIACPCHRQLSIVWINSLSVDKFTFFWQLSIIRTNVHGMDNCSYYFITCLCHRHKTCFFVAKLTKWYLCPLMDKINQKKNLPGQLFFSRTLVLGTGHPPTTKPLRPASLCAKL